jgi:hypothetical protein
MHLPQSVPNLVGRGGRSITSGFLPAALVAAALAPALAWAYGEDDSTDDHSTAHYDIVLAIARCAGFSAADATTIAEADQVTDTLSYGATVFNFTARDGLYRSYFHFPEAGGSVDASGAGPLRSWAAGIGTLTDSSGTLGACTATGTCCDALPPRPISGHCVTRGSHEAIGIWLHAVGDYWSHHACISAGGTDHTHYDASDAAQAAYCPTSMHNHEWGTRETTGYNATLQANALTGLETVRDVLVTYATNHHLTSCGTISDAKLSAFASETTAAARVSAAQALYGTCNTACP